MGGTVNRLQILLGRAVRADGVDTGGVGGGSRGTPGEPLLSCGVDEVRPRKQDEEVGAPKPVSVLSGSRVSQGALLLLLSRFSRVRLCDPTDGSPPGSPASGILQARTLEWVAISFSSA